MQFGKPDNPDLIDFSLPKDPKINGQTIVNQDGSIELLTGGTGWGMKDWKGKLYPEKAPVRSFLEHYAKQFRTVELNSFFYNIPKDQTILNWSEAVPSDFRFSPKVLQYISHAKLLGTDTDRITRMQYAIELFGDKLGPSFMQLPPYFDTRRLPILKTFLEVWGTNLPLALEFRHPSWFEDSSTTDSLAELLYHHKKGMVITDVGGRRDVCHMSVTSEYAMVRFVGNNLHSSDFSRSDDWAARLDRWFDQGLKQCYFFIHEPDNVNAPELAAYIHNKIIHRDDLITRGPKLFGTEEQLGLF